MNSHIGLTFGPLFKFVAELVIKGDTNNNNLTSLGEDAKIVGFNGNDRLHGGGGDDKLLGGQGNDRLYGDAGDDQIRGGNGNDMLYGGRGSDALFGGGGKDRLYADKGGKDALFGGAGNDILFGGDKNDTGVDLLVGGAGNDMLVAAGDAGDILHGGKGRDTSVSGEGNDTFIFVGGDGRDIVVDFGVGQYTKNTGFEGEGIPPEFEGFDTLVIDKEGFDSFDDLAGRIHERTTNNGRVTVINLGDGDVITFTNNFRNDLPSGTVGASLDADNIIFVSADDYLTF